MTTSGVDEFIAKLALPYKADSRQLSCPTFSYSGVMATLVVKTKKRAQVMFHNGAELNQ